MTATQLLDKHCQQLPSVLFQQLIRRLKPANCSDYKL